jgi:hypothetical protein
MAWGMKLTTCPHLAFKLRVNGATPLLPCICLHSVERDNCTFCVAVCTIICTSVLQSQYSHVPACQISTSYYVGFAYMMMRRYSDAIRTFSSILLYIQRTKQLFQSRTYQNDQVRIIRLMVVNAGLGHGQFIFVCFFD